MSLFDVGPGLNSVIGAASGALNVASNLAGALNNLSNPAALISKLRSINLPAGGMPTGAKIAEAQFGGADTSNDWRVRLSIPPAFTSSPVLQPLVQAGNSLIFPYTPTIQISSSASYEDQAITHQNYAYTFYQNSRADQFTISGPFHVEDGAQALYWLAAVHFLRSATKMFTGDGDLQGNPPPILKLNGYGDFVFKNVPVVVKAFQVELPSDVNYINTSVAAASALGFGSGSSSGPLSSVANVSNLASGLGGLAGALGSNKVASALGSVGAIGSAVAGIGNLISAGTSTLLGGGSFGTVGNSWVPVKSSITVTLQPIFSRENMKQFSLQKFVNGNYVTGGYI